MPIGARAALAGSLIWLGLAASAPAALAAPGDLDTSFADGGSFTAPFTTTFPGAENSQSVAVDSQGRVYLSATEEAQLNDGLQRHVKVVRLSSAGALDTSYGSGGTATLPTSGDVRNTGLVIDGQDRAVVLTNSGETSAAWRIVLTRLTTSGQPDPAFDDDGVLTSALPGTLYNPMPTGLALDSEGGLLVVGSLLACGGNVCAQSHGFIARFADSGALDTTYGTGGWTLIGDSTTDWTAVHALPDGGAVLGGFRDYAAWVVAKVTWSGAPDTGFDNDGVATSDLGKGALDLVSAYGVTADNQGRPVVVGQFTSAGIGVVAVARWTVDGTPDPSFGTGSPATGAKLLATAGSRAVDAAAQCVDGKLLIAGMGSRPDLSGNQLTLARLLDDGSLDPQFAAAGATPGVVAMTAGTYNRSSDLALSGAGAYVAAFRRSNEPGVVTDNAQVMRFSANEACADAPLPAPPPPPIGPSTQTPAEPAGPPADQPPVSLPSAAPAPPRLRVSDLVALPSSRACVSRRRFRIRLRVPRNAGVVQADVRLNGKRVAVRRGTRLRSTVDLRGLPKGRFKVQIVLRLKVGKKLTSSRRYRTCTTKRRPRER